MTRDEAIQRLESVSGEADQLEHTMLIEALVVLGVLKLDDGKRPIADKDGSFDQRLMAMRAELDDLLLLSAAEIKRMRREPHPDYERELERLRRDNREFVRKNFELRKQISEMTLGWRASGAGGIK